MKWTNELDDQLRDLIEVKRLKFSEAADIMNLKHMSVVGRCHRLQIKSKNKKGGFRRANIIIKIKDKVTKTKVFNVGPRHDKRLSRKSVMSESINHPAFFDIRGNEKSLFDVGPNDCRFPLSNGEKKFLFCGSNAIENQSYCQHHYDICFEKPKKK